MVKISGGTVRLLFPVTVENAPKIPICTAACAEQNQRSSEMSINVIKVADYSELSRLSADMIATEINKKPSIVLGLPTGSTPIGVYGELVKLYKGGKVSFKSVSAVNLDEYVGLSPDHPMSYRYFMNDNLYNHIDIEKKNTFVPIGNTDDHQAQCKQYSDIIAKLGGIDLLVLGIGTNGHIAFNEPSDCFSRGTYVVELSENTLKANSVHFKEGEYMPEQALTIGIGDIMAARKILLVASGKSKADIIHETMNGKVRPEVPSTILQFHPNVTIVADNEAASRLSR